MCRFFSYKGWLINGQDFWTSSAVATDTDCIWYMEDDGYIYIVVASVAAGGVRSVISISKNTLNKFA